jgi:hypothetical protein
MSVGVPSLADGSKTRRVPHCAVGTLYRTVTSNVPQQPVPQVAWTGTSARTRPPSSSTWSRNCASKTFARPVTRPGEGNAPPQAGRYEFRLYANDRWVGSKSLNVIRAPEPKLLPEQIRVFGSTVSVRWLNFMLPVAGPATGAE